jgi:hypothetical protein
LTTIAGSVSSPPAALPGTRGPIAQLAREWVAISAIAVVGSAIPSILGISLFGYSQLEYPRTVFTMFTLLHFVLCLTSFDRPNEVLRLVITAFIAQPYQVCLGWDFEPGALSFMRILPYLVLIAAFSLAIARRKYQPSKSELALSAAALALGISGWVAGSSYSMVGMTVVLFIGVLLPAFGMYVGSIARSRPDMLPQFGAAIASGLFVLMLGFLASLALAGVVVTSRGEGTLESAREVGDFNALIPYLIFCWPFAVCYLQRTNRFFLALLFVLFVFVTFVGFSRTMMILAPPLMVLSIPVAFPRLRAHTVLFTLCAILLAGWLLLQYVLSSPAGQLFVQLWFARFDIDPLAANFSLVDSLQTVMVGGEAWNERAQLRAEGIRAFLDHPFTGTGWATFPHVSRIQQETSHSLTPDLLQQAGIFAAALFWFVAFEAFSRIILVARQPEARPAAVRIFAFTLIVWVVAAHTVGAQLFKVGDTGFSVNALSGMLFVLFLRREVIAHLCARVVRAA